MLRALVPAALVGSATYFWSSCQQHDSSSSYSSVVFTKYFANKRKNMNNNSGDSLFSVAYCGGGGDQHGGGQPVNTAIAGHWIDGLPEYTVDQIAANAGGPDAFALLDQDPASSSDADQSSSNKGDAKKTPQKKVIKDRVWVRFRSGVYDVTEFVATHPGGGKRLLLAAGDSIEPWWMQFTIHDQPAVFKLLETMRIGNVKGTKDQKFEPIRKPDGGSGGAGGTWENQPTDRDMSVLIKHSQQPFNAEAVAETVTAGGITPASKHFKRSHLPVPDIQLSDYCLSISADDGLIGKKKKTTKRHQDSEKPALLRATRRNDESATTTTTISHAETKKEAATTEEDDAVCPTYAELKSKFKEVAVANTIQCGGNRRSDARAQYPDGDIKGINWKAGAISTSVWSGALLREILLEYAADPAKLLQAVEDEKRCSVVDDISNKKNIIATSPAATPATTTKPMADCKNVPRYHVHFHGADADASANFEVSVPLSLVLDPSREALVAWSMNGEAIPRDHGFPLRAVVPGTVGVRNCKWLDGISIRRDESMGDWQRRDYRNFAPWEKDAKNAHKYDAVYDTPVQSAITSMDEKTRVLKGWAYCGGGREVRRVDVSLDGGNTFTAAAQLSDGGIKQLPGRRWAWKTWQFEVPPAEAGNATGGNKPEPRKICVRALTESGDVQPRVAEYSFRGLFYNGYSCVDL